MKMILSLRESEPDTGNATEEVIREVTLYGYLPDNIEDTLVYKGKQYLKWDEFLVLTDDGQLAKKYIFSLMGDDVNV